MAGGTWYVNALIQDRELTTDVHETRAELGIYRGLIDCPSMRTNDSYCLCCDLGEFFVDRCWHSLSRLCVVVKGFDIPSTYPSSIHRHPIQENAATLSFWRLGLTRFK